MCFAKLLKAYGFARPRTNLVLGFSFTRRYPDINIEDVVLSNMIGEVAENIAHTQCFLV